MHDSVDLGQLTVDGGYFLLKDTPPTRSPFAPYPTPEDRGYRHCFTYTPAGGDPEGSIRRELLRMLSCARKKIFVASFFIGGKELTSALTAAAGRLRGGVYVISAIDDRSLARGLGELEDDLEADKAEKKRFDELTGHGVYLRGHEQCHAKFVVVDDAVALVSSANLTVGGLDRTGENGVVVTDPVEVNRLACLFARLWHAGCTWEIPPGATYSAKKREATSWNAQVPQPTGDPGVIWTDGTERHILTAIHDIIASARNDLLLASFSLKGMRSHPELLLDPLCRAIEDHAVRVRLLTRARNHVPSDREDAAALVAAGVEVFGDRLTHAKGVIADSRRGALFSANFDAEHGLTSGVEVGTRLDCLPALGEAERYFEHAITSANYTFVSGPTIRELNQRLDERWHTPWPLAEQLTVTAEHGAWDRLLQTTAKSGPVLFARRKDGEVDLYAGQQQWRLILTDPLPGTDALLRFIGPPERFQSASDRLEEWLTSRSATEKRADARGFCPATMHRHEAER